MGPKDLLTTAIGIVLGVILEKPLTDLRDTLLLRVKRIFYKKPQPVSEEFSFGSIKTSWRVLDGTGEETYEPETITTHFESKKAAIDPLIREQKEEIQKHQENLRKQGKHYSWNGEQLTLDKFIISRSGYEENLQLELWFQETDYYTFLAGDQLLENKEIKEKLIEDTNWEKPIANICNSLGINLTVITEDDYILLTKRSKSVGTYKDLYHISVNEGLNRALDRGVHNQAPDVYRCALRALAEELGIVDVTAQNIELLSFGVDVEHVQWGILGLAKINKTADEILEWRNRGAKDKWETTEIHLLKFHIDEVVKFVANHPNWTPAGLTCLYQTLVHEFKRSKVEEKIHQYIHA